MFNHFFVEAIIFLSYIFICAAVFKSRFSRLVTMLVLGAAGIVIAGVNAAIMLSSSEVPTLMLTLLPLTAYLPFSVLLYFISDCGVFETTAVCSFGMLDVLILRLLHKTIIGFGTGFSAGFSAGFGIGLGINTPLYAMADVITSLTAAGLVFIAFRFIGKAFRFCVIENHQNRMLLSVPIISIFLMMFWFLNSTTNEITLIFTVLIALSIFFIIARLLNSSAELIRVKHLEKQLSEYIDVQRRGYDKVVRKMEATREYRHDMRHHLAVIEGLAKQGDCEKIIEYTGKMSGSLSATESVSYCKSPEINAVLSEYISRAENTGCRITQNVALPARLPFAEDDVCIMLANSIENAINACAKLPEEQRYIDISVECTDNHRLLVSVKNPCAEQLSFGENGLPIVDEKSPRYSDEHGVGLRSASRIAKKYNGFLRCKLENGEFMFQAALFYDENASEHKIKGAKTENISKRAVSSLLGLGAGVLIMLNTLPSAAEAASSLLSVNIRTIRSLHFGWGSNSISTEYPVFNGSGSDELNSVVTDYVNEAREKFMWYFNRRYNGYVAEDMRYTVIRNDDRYFIARFNVTINAGGSMDYGRWIVFDKSAGKVLELGDMVGEGSDYIKIISDEILRQMRFKNENEGKRFFVDGDDAFTEISEDANFYIDAYDRLVIVFDEYEVAPGFMGSPEFIIPDKILEEAAR